ncbi:hypothetical protein GQ231_000828 [Salmonella enterica]|nr:hypothetical protein [Salmonella enterica]
MSSKDQQSQCKKFKLYNSEIMDLQFKIEKISQILKDFDEHSLQVDDKKKITIKTTPKVNKNIANVLNISYEECVNLPTKIILKKLSEEQKKSKNVAMEKLKFITTISQSLLHLATIRHKK